MARVSVVMAVVLGALLFYAPAAIAQQSVAQLETPTISVFIAGAVHKPGAFRVKPTDGVPELIAQAGGATPRAILTKVIVKRVSHS